MSNLKPAPLFLTEDVVGKLLGDRPAYGKGIDRVPVTIGVDLGSAADMSVEAVIESDRVITAREVRRDIQRKCRACGQWRVSACKYRACPLAIVGARP